MGGEHNLTQQPLSVDAQVLKEQTQAQNKSHILFYVLLSHERRFPDGKMTQEWSISIKKKVQPNSPFAEWGYL